MQAFGRGAMVASPQYLATGAGVAVLRQGGNAVDAAIAVDAVLGVVAPYTCGIGGDLFAIVVTPDGDITGLDGSGRAPQGADLERVRSLAQGDRMPDRGPLPITVPGCVEAWGKLHRRFGRLPLSQVLLQAVQYARDGFPVSRGFSRAIGYSASLFHPDTPASATYLPGGIPPQAGSVFRNPRLASTLQTIAEHGPQAYYSGPIAGEIARSVQAIGGLLAEEDLAAHTADWVQPLSLTYRDVVVYELPPASQGMVALLMLNILQQLPPGGLEAGGEEYVHLLAEAARLAHADREAHITDRDHMAVAPESLLSTDYARRRASQIGPRATAPAVAGMPGGTAYMCAADADGLLVSLIQSNYMGIGSGVMAGETGILLQNRGAWFSLDPSHINAIAPRKRTTHTLMPAVAFRDGRPWLVFGTMGGSAQAQIHAQLLTRLIDVGMPLEEAISAPRFDAVPHPPADQGTLTVEDGIPQEVVESLRERGHEVRMTPQIGHAHAIEVLPDGVYQGVSDPRTESLALGY